jgi:DNA-binding NarL/FixJ family response regulator
MAPPEAAEGRMDERIRRAAAEDVVVKPLHILVAIRDRSFAGAVHAFLRRAHHSPVPWSEFATENGAKGTKPEPVDAILLEAGELLEDGRRYNAAVHRLPAGLPVIVILTERQFPNVLRLPGRIDGLLFLDPIGGLRKETFELALAGYCAFPEEVLETVAGGGWYAALTNSLTAQERQVFALLGTGATNRQIGSRLGCSEAAAKTMVRSVLHKVGASNRTMGGILAAYALRTRLM